MLSISIPSNGRTELTFSRLANYDIPAPPNGFSPEVNDDAVMHFEDEQQAVDYAHELDAFSNALDRESEEYKIVGDIIKAVGDDKFVQEFLQS